MTALPHAAVPALAAALPAGLLCPAPFMVMDFAPEGNVHACCVNAAHPLGNVRFQTLREIWEGERASALRAAMARHDFGYGCGSCRHRLEAGTGEPDLAYYGRNPPPRDVAWPELMAFGLHNTCNLACVMCGGNLSSRLRVLEGRPRLEPAYGDRFFAELEEFLPHLRRAEFRGGEPFLVREHFRIFEVLIALGTGLETQATTNGTVWNERVERVLEALAMQVTFSIDGVTAATNTTIRVGTDHAVVLENLQRFAEHARVNDTRLDVSFCVLQHNWRELADLLRLADELDVEGHPQLVLDPEHGLQRLPAVELEDILRHLEGQTGALERDLDREDNRAAWHKILGWIEAELRQRAGGTPLRLWEPPSEGSVRHVAATRGQACGDGSADHVSAEPTLAERRAELIAWSSTGTVGALITDAADRVVTAALAPLVPAGWSAAPDVVGLPFASALEQLTDHLGPYVWVVDEFLDSGVVDQTLLLSPTPLRDKAGLLVRAASVAVASGGIHTVLAIDTYFWSNSEVEVGVSGPGTRPPGARPGT